MLFRSDPCFRLAVLDTAESCHLFIIHGDWMKRHCCVNTKLSTNYNGISYPLTPLNSGTRTFQYTNCTTAFIHFTHKSKCLSVFGSPATVMTKRLVCFIRMSPTQPSMTLHACSGTTPKMNGARMGATKSTFPLRPCIVFAIIPQTFLL